MEKLKETLREIIDFREKYKWSDVHKNMGPPGGAHEELESSFTINKDVYKVYQTWDRNPTDCCYSFSMLKNNRGAKLDISFIRELLQEIDKSV